MLIEPFTISRRDFDAAIFDLDGVLTETARVHAVAWKVVFDAFLRKWAQQHDEPFQPFDSRVDYFDYVDGRPRYDGIRNFLSSRGIRLPEGSEHDPEDADTVHALGERKARSFRQMLQKGIDPAAGSEVLLKKLREVGVRTAVGSSSAHTRTILHAARLEQHFDVCVDGIDADALKLPGKPDPALYLEAARRLGVRPSRAMLFEDSLVGVEAGKRGGFGCVVGVDHGQNPGTLRQRGADVVIKSLQEMHIETN